MSCDGKCCAAFFWPRTPQELRDDPCGAGGTTTTESAYIADMLIPLTLEQLIERTMEFGIGWGDENLAVIGEHADAGHYYTCKHWDEETRMCTAYEQRPQMCREYPYGRRCEHGCDFRLVDTLLADRERRHMEQGVHNVTLGEN